MYSVVSAGFFSTETTEMLSLFIAITYTTLPTFAFLKNSYSLTTYSPSITKNTTYDFIINQLKIAVMDFLFSIGIRKMPKIPDKYNSCLLTSFELTDIQSKKELLKFYLNKKTWQFRH